MIRFYIFITLLARPTFSSQYNHHYDPQYYDSRTQMSAASGIPAADGNVQQLYQPICAVGIETAVLFNPFQVVPSGNFMLSYPHPWQNLQTLPSYIYVPNEEHQGNQKIVHYTAVPTVQLPAQFEFAPSYVQIPPEFPFYSLVPLESNMANLYELQVPQSLQIDPVLELKTRLIAAIRDQRTVEISRTVFDNKTFLYNLHSNHLSRSLPLEIHLNWLIEFQNLVIEFEENMLEYYDYIKIFHLRNELKTESFDDLIASVIVKLIENRYNMPEVVHDLLKNGFSSLQSPQIKRIHQAFKIAVLQFGDFLSRNEIVRMLYTLESLLEFIPVPPDVVLIGPSEHKMSFMRFILQLAPIYKAILGVEDFNEKAVSVAISIMNQKSNGEYFETDFLTFYGALNLIYKRAFLHIIHAEQFLISLLDQRLKLVSEMLFSSVLNTDNFYNVVKTNLFYLSEAYITYSDADIEFDLLMITAYKYCGPDKLHALKYAQSYLSVYQLDLAIFRKKYRDKFITAGIGKNFILVLEALIAALEDVSNPTGETCFETWEPNRNFLILQNEIYEKRLSKEDESADDSILEAPFLGLAARTFLSRQIGLPCSFSETRFIMDGFSWADAISFVNFYFDHFSLIFTVKFHIRSHFCEDLMKKYENTPTFEEIMSVFDSKEYPSIGREID